jgi:hypothetical protein
LTIKIVPILTQPESSDRAGQSATPPPVQLKVNQLRRQNKQGQQQHCMFELCFGIAILSFW